MEFEEMRKIWDEQSQRPLYVIDEVGLHRRVQRKSKKIKRTTVVFEWVMIFIVLLTGGFLLIDAIIDQESIYSYLNAIIIMLVSVPIYLARQRRLRSSQHFDSSMRGEIDRALATVNYQIDRLRRMFWWYMLPFLIGWGLNLVETYQDRPIWAWILLPVALLIANWLVRWEIRCMHEPRRRDLEALKGMLDDGEDLAVGSWQ